MKKINIKDEAADMGKKLIYEIQLLQEYIKNKGLREDFSLWAQQKETNDRKELH